MQINQDTSLITFTHLVSAKKSDIGSAQQTIEPAPKSVAANARGVFQGETLESLHKDAVKSATALKTALLKSV